MLKTPEEIKAKLAEIEELRNSGKYTKFEDASKAAGMGKNWYFDNIKKYRYETSNKINDDTANIKVIPSETTSIGVSVSKPKKNKNTCRVLVTLSRTRYDYYKAIADKRDMDLSQLLAYVLGEAEDKGLI
jgi:hypothetical protein